MMLRVIIALFLTIAVGGAASAQAPIISGNLTPGHTLGVLDGSNRVLGDGGGAAGSTTNGYGYLTEIGITNTGTPFCINDALISGPYHQFCLGALANGGGLISYNAYGGATALPLTININGVNYPFPGTQSGIQQVADNATLKTTATTAAAWVVRNSFASPGDAPPLWYYASSSPCSLNSGAGDNGSQVQSSDGKCWIAVFQDQKIDIREFGAVADNSTPADAAMTATLAYAAGKGACAYVPSVYPGFTFQSPVTIQNANNGTECLVGDRGIKNWPTIGAIGAGVGALVDMHFPNNTDGIVIAASNGWRVSGVAIQGNAVLSTSPTHTVGLTYANGIVQGTVDHVFIMNFVVCKEHQADATSNEDSVLCDMQNDYPNVVNDFPFACNILEDYNGSGATADIQETGSECRAQSGGMDVTYTGNGSTSWFQICVPAVMTSTPTIGTQLTCTGPTEYGVPLWRADGVKLALGHGATPLANGQSELNGPITPCDPTVYTIWDVSASGGGGTGGTQLYCNTFSASITNGSTTLTVSDTSSIPTGTNILVTADHGIQLATKVVSINSPTTLTMSKAAYYTQGTLSVTITQLAASTSGPPNYSRTCQATNACGYKIELRLATPPTSGEQVTLEWIDPTGYAAYIGNNVSDYVHLKPNLVGGWDVALKHIGLSDGGIEFRPTYVELLNYCVEIEGQLNGGQVVAPYGDDVNIHRVINDPIPYCPGYVNPYAAGTRIVYNGQTYYDPSSPSPGYVSGNYYLPVDNLTTSTVAIVQNTVYCIPSTRRAASGVTGAAVNIASGGTGNVSFAMYDNDPPSNRPGNLLAKSSTASVPASGSVNATMKPTSIMGTYPIGLYWLCSLFSANGPNVTSISNALVAAQNVVGPGAAQLGDSTPSTLLAGAQAVGVTHSSSTFPDSLVGTTADSAGPGSNGLPLVVWKR